MSNVETNIIPQRLQARIIKAERSSYWYAGMIGMKFEVERTPKGLRLVEKEAQEIRKMEDDEDDATYYVYEEDCRVIRIGGEPNE